MTRRDRKLLDKQFSWVDRSPAERPLAFSAVVSILLVVLLFII